MNFWHRSWEEGLSLQRPMQESPSSPRPGRQVAEAGGHSAALELFMMAGLRRHCPHRDWDRLSLLCEEPGPTETVG